jgi:hypothetical protein
MSPTLCAFGVRRARVVGRERGVQRAETTTELGRRPPHARARVVRDARARRHNA